jgi:hypothetical protein
VNLGHTKRGIVSRHTPHEGLELLLAYTNILKPSIYALTNLCRDFLINDTMSLRVQEAAATYRGIFLAMRPDPHGAYSGCRSNVRNIILIEDIANLILLKDLAHTRQVLEEAGDVLGVVMIVL